MKFIYKTRNLALTALFGAALAMGTPAAMAQGAVNNTVPAPDDQNASTGDYQGDYNLLKQYMDYVLSEAASYQEAYPEIYDDVFAPTVDAIVSQIQEMISKVEEAKTAAEQGGSAYVSPVPENFYQDLTKDLQQLREDGVWAQVSLAQQQVQSLGSALNGKVAQLKSLFDEKIASVVGEDAESFFLGEATSDVILEQLQGMEANIGKAADEAEKVDYEKFVSPVTPEWVSDMNQQILDFYDGCQKLILKTEANIQNHGKDLEDIDLLQGLLTDASKEIDDKFESVLGEYMGPQEKYVVTNASQFEALQAQIDEFRQDVEAAAAQAKADNWQSYDKSSALGGSVANFQKEINQYKKTGLNRVDKARSTLRKHDSDISTTILVENKLGNKLTQVQTYYSNTLKDIIGKPNRSGEACFYYEEMFYAIQHTIDDMRYAIVAAYDAAVETCFETYDSPVGKSWSADMTAQIDEYGEVCESRINTALENLQLHDQSVEQVSIVDVSLVDAFNEVVDYMNAKLGEDLSLEDQDFFVGADTFDKIEAEIDDLRALLIQAYDKAEEDNWQSYDSKVGEGIASITEQITKYKNDCEYLADNALAQTQLHEQDIEFINALEGMLADAANAIIEKFNSLGGQDADLSDEEIARITNEAGFDAIQEQIDGLRKAMVEAATRAEADHWQNYQQEASGVEAAIPGVEADIAAYQAEGERLVQTSLGVGFEDHENNIATLSSLESKLMEAVGQAQSLYAEKLEDVIGEADEAFFYNEDEFDAIQAQIDSERVAVANAYEQAEASGKYESPITDEWVTDLEGQIQAYYDECEYRVNNALAQLQLFDQDIEHISNVEASLVDAFNEVVDNMSAKLGEDLSLEDQDFFVGEQAYNKIAEEIDALRTKAIEAYDKAQAGNWQSYQSDVNDDITAIDEQIAKYKDDTEYLADNALAQMQLHDQDIEYINALEGLLAEAANAISEKFNSLIGEDVELTDEEIARITNEAQFDAIQAQIDALRKAMVDEATRAEADHWQKYDVAATGLEEAIPQLEAEIASYQSEGEKNVELALGNFDAHDSNIATLASLETKLMAAVSEAQALYAEKLEDILGDADEAFFFDEKDFDSIQAQIDAEREAVAKAYEEAFANESGVYKSPITEAWLNEIEAQIQAYSDECEYRVNNAVAQLQLFEEDLEYIQGLDSELFQAVVEVQNYVMGKLGVDELTDEQEEFFLKEKAYDQLSAQIDALRSQAIAAYDKAAEDNWQNYDQQASGVKDGVYQIEQAIAQYKDDCEYLANNADAQMQLHDEDVQLVNGLDTELFQAVVEVQNYVMEKLGVEDLSDQEETFFLDEKVYNEIAAQIDALRMSVVEAYDKAEADNWQNYDQEASGVKEQAYAIEQAIAKYKEDCEYLADNAQAQMQLHDEDVELVNGLDVELFQAVMDVQSMMQDRLAQVIDITDEMAEFFQNEAQFDAIQAQIDALRMSVVEAYDKAAAGNWQNYDQEASGVKEQAYAIEQAISEYKDDCEYRVNNALANIQLHDEDVEMVSELEGSLMRTFGELAEEVDGNIDADILEGIRAFLIEDGYDEVAAQIDALRRAMVEQYDVAAADNWQKYEQQVVPNTTAIDQAIAQYKEESQERTMRALQSIEAHQYDVDVIVPLDQMLGDSVAELMEEHPELFEEGSEFLAQYEELSQDVQDLWSEIKAAADAAEADNWQSYNSVFAGVDAEALYHEVEDFFASAWGDVATINLNRWDNDNNAVLQLEGMLMSAVNYIQENNPDFDVDPDFDAIQAAIDSLRQRMAQAYEEADEVAWQSYECPYTESDLEEVGKMIDDMVERATSTTGISGVNGDIEQPMIFTVDGKRLNAPIKGELNIFVYGNRVEKRIVK